MASHTLSKIDFSTQAVYTGIRADFRKNTVFYIYRHSLIDYICTDARFEDYKLHRLYDFILSKTLMKLRRRLLTVSVFIRAVYVITQFCSIA